MVSAARGLQPGDMTTFGLHLTSYPGPDAGSIAAYARDVAVAAEDSGVFGTLWLTDHLQSPHPAAPVPESHLVLANVAACTRRLSLGLLAASVVYRNPALLAKMITTIDVLSGGRAILGIGAGHPRTQADLCGFVIHERIAAGLQSGFQGLGVSGGWRRVQPAQIAAAPARQIEFVYALVA